MFIRKNPKSISLFFPSYSAAVLKWKAQWEVTLRTSTVSAWCLQ